jgi:hypothetical protein
MSKPTADVALDFLIEARARLDDAAGLVRHCLGQLDDDQLWWRPGERMNSIGNLTLHLAGNLRQRFEVNIAGLVDVRDRVGEFTRREVMPRGELLRRFDESVAAAEARVGSLAPEKLVEMRPVQWGGEDVEATVLSVILRTLTHLAGHAQEIVFMTRMQLGDRYDFRTPSLVPPEMRPNG